MFVGCDLHKKYSYVVTKDQHGNTIDSVKLYHADKTELKNFFSALPKDSQVALESCSFNYWVGDLIESIGLPVKIAHTAKTKAIAEERIKTDKISAGVLADLLRTNLLPEAYRAPHHVRDARTLMRYRFHILNVRTKMKNRIHALIDYNGIQQSFTDLFGKAGRQFLSQLILPNPYRYIIDQCLSVVDMMTTLVNHVDRMLRRQIKDDPRAQLLTTIPGIGVITAHIILAEIGEISRFKNRHKLASYIGIIPRIHQSGQISYYGHITKSGNRYLRTAFVEAAQTAIRHDIYLKHAFNKIKAKKGYGVAIVAVAHKLVKSTYALLTKQKPYQYRAV
ncbi:MAG: IS110 family transposase [Elusimicrobia bacterium]|nr:IS110 family transposase [Elusimicrobiota bacterium]